MVCLLKKAGFLNQGARNSEPARAPVRLKKRSARADPHFALSFIRTVTVGFGITPKSADPGTHCEPQALAGLCCLSFRNMPPSPPVGNFAPP